MRVPKRCRPERYLDYHMGLEYGPHHVPSPTPPIRKLMLDVCLSEYDESLRGTLSWPPHPCAMDITSSVPVYRPIIKKHRSSTSKLKTYVKKIHQMFSADTFQCFRIKETNGRNIQLLSLEIHTS